MGKVFLVTSFVAQNVVSEAEMKSKIVLLLASPRSNVSSSCLGLTVSTEHAPSLKKTLRPTTHTAFQGSFSNSALSSPPSGGVALLLLQHQHHLGRKVEDAVYGAVEGSIGDWSRTDSHRSALEWKEQRQMARELRWWECGPR